MRRSLQLSILPLHLVLCDDSFAVRVKELLVVCYLHLVGVFCLRTLPFQFRTCLKLVEALVEDVLGIPKRLHEAELAARLDCLVRIEEPVLLSDLHPRLEVSLVDHSLDIHVPVVLKHSRQLRSLYIQGAPRTDDLLINC